MGTGFRPFKKLVTKQEPFSDYLSSFRVHKLTDVQDNEQQISKVTVQKPSQSFTQNIETNLRYEVIPRLLLKKVSFISQQKHRCVFIFLFFNMKRN